MKKGLAILLLLVYAFGATDFHQVFKLPRLIAHYQKHHHDDPALTVSRFFRIHYWQPQQFDRDYKEDMQLPFKAPKDYCVSAPTVMPGPALFLTVPLFEEHSDNHFPREANMTSRLIVKSIFQPPPLV